ncbi:hypothetical protein MMC10_007850 [Thelotrema lepadinum]|nr:hypothetical protein [Thelotrema lepadinum]
MDSETDTSTVTTCTTPNLTESRSESYRDKNHRSADATWAHTHAAHEDENPKHKYCKYCIETPYGTSVTTNLRGHLKSKHEIVIIREQNVVQLATQRQLRNLYSRVDYSEDAKEIDALAFKKHLNQEVIDEALASLIVVGNLPFRIITLPQFHAFCQTLNPESKDYITTSYSQVPKKIDQSF